jgi:nicotinate-nucleotide pyrophosphorylase
VYLLSGLPFMVKDSWFHVSQTYGFRGTIAGTRKTMPGIVVRRFDVTHHMLKISYTVGFRHVKKYIILVGGIDPHRFDPSTMIMLKDITSGQLVGHSSRGLNLRYFFPS